MGPSPIAVPAPCPAFRHLQLACKRPAPRGTGPNRKRSTRGRKATRHPPVQIPKLGK
jgi:hypothetical protein